MASDVCKHCTHAACLDVCPTGAIFRTESSGPWSCRRTSATAADTAACPPAPYGVLDKREDDGRIYKCTLCYDRYLHDGQEPACAKAWPDRFDPVRRP